MSQSPSADAVPFDQTWNSIEKLANEVAATSKEALPECEFYAGLLNRSVSSLAAVASVVWNRDRRGFRVDQQVNVAETPLADELRRSDHLRLLDTVWDGKDPKLALPHSGSEADGQSGNPTGLLLLLCPVRIEGETVRVVEIIQRPTTDPEIQTAYLSLLSALCEAASDFHRNSELRTLRKRRSFWQESQQFARRVHARLSLKQVAYVMANDGRLLIGCDRASVAVCRGTKSVILAASGVDRVARRSAGVRLLERLSAMVAATGEMLWYDGNSGTLPPEFESLLQPYVDESHVRLLAIAPLRDQSADAARSDDSATPTIGVLIGEQYDADWDEELRLRLRVACEHSEVALANALRHRNVLRRGMEWLLQTGTLMKTLAVVLLVAAIAAAMLGIKADFDIEARGELLPQNRQDVFAPADGEVHSLAVEHNTAVDQGATLLEVDSPELDLEYERVLGEKRTTHQKLLAAQSERVRKNTPSSEDRRRMATWSAIEKELEKEIESLQQQLDILDKQLESLKVRSPMDGRVLTWDVSGLLESRPVIRGQVLLTVADVDGPWVLELEIPDHHISHISEAQQASSPNLDVYFILKTNPDVTYQGTIDRISMRTLTDDDGSAYVKAIVAIDRDAVAPLTSGASVVAKIRCGRESIGYVWLHDLIDAVKTWVLF
ncbi:MAG: HlyD family efflux transporter periplasmic adaptor subunit [Planctomycetes bacterium]|nr:HlyD family efflux transporter periplasmic adaptor subunit [Planctomycetota bacterium]MBL7042551.1 HlyD family efflux transporter periplasmic adaptor subunit [Pirellulaceae bacterium]